MARLSRAEKALLLYDSLPKEFHGWQQVEKAELLLQVNKPAAKNYLRLLQMFGYIKWNGSKMIKIQKEKKDLIIPDDEGE